MKRLIWWTTAIFLWIVIPFLITNCAFAPEYQITRDASLVQLDPQWCQDDTIKCCEVLEVNGHKCTAYFWGDHFQAGINWNGKIVMYHVLPDTRFRYWVFGGWSDRDPDTATKIPYDDYLELRRTSTQAQGMYDRNIREFMRGIK